MKHLALLSIFLALPSCSLLQNLKAVEGFTELQTPDGNTVFLASISADLGNGFVYYGAEADAGVRDAKTKVRLTPEFDLNVGEMRYWDKERDVNVKVPIGTELPLWVGDMLTADEVANLKLQFIPEP